MEKYKRYYGVIIFIVTVFLIIFLGYKVIMPKVDEMKQNDAQIENLTKDLDSKKQKLKIVKDKIAKIKSSISSSQKKIYSPIESDLGNDTLFFTLYNDVIEMIHQNSIKIKSIDYVYNPESDTFVQFGKDIYFVCDVNMELVSNYTNLGKLIQDIYQYPYYIKINNIDINPYQKDKKILLTNMGLRLYAHTTPIEQSFSDIDTAPSVE